jgi:hypothetical protein
MPPGSIPEHTRVLTLTNPLIFDSNVNHEHLQEADVDSSFVAARADPLKLGHPRGATTILRPTDWPITNLLKSRLKK